MYVCSFLCYFGKKFLYANSVDLDQTPHGTVRKNRLIHLKRNSFVLFIQNNSQLYSVDHHEEQSQEFTKSFQRTDGRIQ